LAAGAGRDAAYKIDMPSRNHGRVRVQFVLDKLGKQEEGDRETA